MPSRPAALGVGDGGLLAHVLDAATALGLEPVVLLGVVAGDDAVAEADRAGVGLGLAGQDAQQGGLAGAVEPHDQQALAAADVEVTSSKTVGPP